MLSVAWAGLRSKYRVPEQGCVVCLSQDGRLVVHDSVSLGNVAGKGSELGRSPVQSVGQGLTNDL